MICYLQPVVKQHHGGAVTPRVRPVHRLVLQRVRDLDREAEHEADVAADRRPSRHTRRGPRRTRDETGAGRGRRRRKAFRGVAEERHRGNFNRIFIFFLEKGGYHSFVSCSLTYKMMYYFIGRVICSISIFYCLIN